MKMELYNYAITPIVFPEGREVEITVRPLGDHAAFRQESYTILLHEIDDMYSKRNQKLENVKPCEDGCLRFSAVFTGEREHFVYIK